MVEFTKETVNLLGGNVVYQRGGAGESILYLHGAGVVSQAVPFMKHLGAHFDVIVPQHPGMGESDAPTWLNNMHDMALFYHDFIDRLGLEDIHLIGTSIGGWLAATVAYLNPAPFKSVTLACAAGLNNPDIPKPPIYGMTAAETLRFVIHDQELAESMVAKMPPGVDEMPNTVKSKATTKIMAGETRHDPSMPTWLHRLKMPVHIIWGKQDKLSPVQYAAEYKKLLPHAKVTLYDNCGHLPYTEHPEQYARDIAAFIQTFTGAKAA
ncbi:MAG: alpha/beta hydrolase [Proteobacteria bacterium]|nr:alpha/beta hydrolase [Pseudomonadota bacterium]MDA1057755.1 alpha/beta hydrolase [Pseudomonadota bacterium]